MPNPDDYDRLPPIEWLITGAWPTNGKAAGVPRPTYEVLVEWVIYDIKPATPHPVIVEIDELDRPFRSIDPFLAAALRATDFHRAETFSTRYGQLGPQVPSLSQPPPRGGWRPGMCYASGLHPTAMIRIDEAPAFTAAQRATIAAILAGSRRPLLLRIRDRIAGGIRRRFLRHRGA